MSLINQDIKNLVSGISQQPPILRHPEQLEEQVNGFSSEAAGLQKRLDASGPSFSLPPYIAQQHTMRALT